MALSTAVGALAAVALAGAPSAGAASINHKVFELDGNAASDGAVNPLDWDEVYAGQVPASSSTPKSCPKSDPDGSGVNSAPPLTASACSWIDDGALNATIFTGGGSKDPNDISSWKWKDESGGLPDKDNLRHDFAARYTDGPSELLYFGSDRHSNEGDAHQAFWFFQNKVETRPDGTFSGVHKNGDLLVISEFSNGGTVSTIVVYKWDNTAAGNLKELARGTNAKCDANNPGQAFCGIVNPADGTPSPWPFTDKFGSTSFRQGEFFEGGIDLNHSAIQLGGQCFASFASETRSSTSTTAVLKDFVLGGFGDCGSSTVTTPKQWDGTSASDIPATGVSIGTGGSVLVRDSAEVKVTGSVKPTGSVAFWLCGPTARDSSALCETGGASVGTTAISPTNTENPVTVLSPVAKVTAAGRYCFRAVYSGDAAKGITGSSDFSSRECFVVNPVTPTLTTQAGTTPVLLGQQVTDRATLSGTARKPGSPAVNPTTEGLAAGGTITFGLYGPGSDKCGTLVAGSTSTSPVTGDGTYDATPVAPTAPGEYYWKATYSGDAPNTNATTQHNADCADPLEKVVVEQLTPAISTAQSFVPNDSATITVTGGGDLAGTVRFELHDNATCTGTPLYDSGAVDVASGTGTGLSRTVTSSNTTAYSTTRSFWWKVTYASTNAGHTGATHACGIEQSSITIDNNAAATQ